MPHLASTMAQPARPAPTARSWDRKLADAWTGWKATAPCACSPGYAGHYCQDASCTVVGCSEHGVCSNEGTPDGAYECVCRLGYYGKYCQSEQSCLITEGCLNGGTCEVLPSGEAQCACEPGHNGTFCEEAFGCRLPDKACQNGGLLQSRNPGPGSADVRCFCTAE